MLQNIPAELRSYRQWVCASSDKIPLNPRTGEAASPTDPATWGSFDEAHAAVMSGRVPHLGFVFAETDPYAVIDLDNKERNPCPPALWTQYEQAVATFDSYVERSASGRGYHIIVKGNVPGGGMRRDEYHIELYSTKRYAIFTGDVVRNVPIVEKQTWINTTAAQLSKSTPRGVDLDEDEEELMSDADLVEMACNAKDGEKYLALSNGKWQEMKNDQGAALYPSQSEADFALLSMLAFYTRNNEQVRRLFRYSGLGAREKAWRDDYLNAALAKIRAKQVKPLSLEQLTAMKQAFVAQATAETDNGEGKERSNSLASTLSVSQPSIPESPPPVDMSSSVPDIELPPGLIGEIAAYIYKTSVRPVPEVALAASLAFSAGVVGRSYNISATGLNQYLILVAGTGKGKEGAISGINRLVAAVRTRVPIIDGYLGPSTFASGQALVRRLDQQPCFVSVLGEFGLTLQNMCDESANASQVQLRKVLLDLYQKSGWNDSLLSSVYADSEKNTKVIQAPSVTLLGETTPETFFEGLDASHIAEGLIPRFSVIQYDGPRVGRNENANQPPDAALLERVVNLVTVALTTSNARTCAMVGIEPTAKAMLDQYDKRADAEINSTTLDVETQLWNRAHLKALKLAALLAVGCAPHAPIIDERSARWALDFVNRDINTMLRRFKSGDVGRGDSKLAAELRRIIVDYLRSQRRSDVPQVMFQAGIIPWGFLQRRTSNIAAYRKDRRGSMVALKATVQGLVEAGVLLEIQPSEMMARFQSRGRGFTVTPEWRNE